MTTAKFGHLLDVRTDPHNIWRSDRPVCPGRLVSGAWRLVSLPGRLPKAKLGAQLGSRGRGFAKNCEVLFSRPRRCAVFVPEDRLSGSTPAVATPCRCRHRSGSNRCPGRIRISDSSPFVVPCAEEAPDRQAPLIWIIRGSRSLKTEAYIKSNWALERGSVGASSTSASRFS